jgi:LuxR family maltose regulon positive regulatory protein
MKYTISGKLCQAFWKVVGQSGSQLVLEQLEQANLFIETLDGRREWYRYHALFAEALHYRLEETEGEAVSTLHLRASQWYAGQRYLNEAVRHAISARNWPWAADLIEQVHTLIWSSNEHAIVRRLLEQLPVEVVRSRPRLCLAYAKYCTSLLRTRRWNAGCKMQKRGSFHHPNNRSGTTF